MMKTLVRLLTVTMLLIAAAVIYAEGQDVPERPGRPGEARRMKRPGRMRKPNDDRPGAGLQGEEGPRGPWRQGENRRRGSEWERRPGQREQVRKAMSWLQKNDPEEFNRLSQLRDKNPRALRREIGMVLRKYAKEKNPDLYHRLTESREHVQRMRTLARQYRNETDPEKRAALESEMKTVIGDAFDKKMASRRQELEKLEARIREFREILKKSEENRQNTIDTRFKKWMQEPDSEE
jgi:hypothetical protein